MEGRYTEILRKELQIDTVNTFVTSKVDMNPEEVFHAQTVLLNEGGILEQMVIEINSRKPNFSKNILYSGSFFEGVKVCKPDEFNLMLEMELPGSLIVTDSSHAGYVNVGLVLNNTEMGSMLQGIRDVMEGKEANHERNPAEATSVPQKPGTSHQAMSVSATAVSETKSSAKTLSVMDYINTSFNIVTLDPRIIQHSLHEIVFEVTNKKKWRIPPLKYCYLVNSLNYIPNTGLPPYKTHGPSSMCNVMEIQDDRKVELCEFDLVPAVTWLEWPKCANSWPTKKWLSEELVNLIKCSGVHLVPKQAKDTFFAWRVSFSFAEKVIMNVLDTDGGERRKILKVLKKLREDYWCPTDKLRQAVPSYVLKTLFLLECEKFQLLTDWSGDELIFRLADVIEQLCYCLEKGYCPHYFIDQLNLFEGSDPNDLGEVLSNIKKMLYNPHLQYYFCS